MNKKKLAKVIKKLGSPYWGLDVYTPAQIDELVFDLPRLKTMLAAYYVQVYGYTSQMPHGLDRRFMDGLSDSEKKNVNLREMFLLLDPMDWDSLDVAAQKLIRLDIIRAERFIEGSLAMRDGGLVVDLWNKYCTENMEWYASLFPMDELDPTTEVQKLAPNFNCGAAYYKHDGEKYVSVEYDDVINHINLTRLARYVVDTGETGGLDCLNEWKPLTKPTIFGSACEC